MIRTLGMTLLLGAVHASGFNRHSGGSGAPQMRKKPAPTVMIRQQRANPLNVKETREVVPALTRLEGVLINSILAGSLRPTIFIVRIEAGNHPLAGAELRCAGMAPERRVLSRCDLMVHSGNEYAVNVVVWDKDGGGMLPDKYYSGEEKSFLTSSFAAFLGGIWEAAKDRITTPFGIVSKKSGKNAILEGLTQTAQNSQNLIKESGRKDQSISFVNSGRRVRVVFNNSLNLKEVKP